MSRHVRARPVPGPTPAERARTVLRAAPVLEVTAAGVRCTVDRHGADRFGRPVLLVADAGPLATVLAGAEGPVPTLIDAAQVRPLPGPDRVRARVELLGWIDVVPSTAHRSAMATLPCALPTPLSRSQLGGSVLRAEILTVAVDGTPVDPDDFALAEPDPLVDHEAGLLRALLADRAHDLARLCELLDVMSTVGATEIVPVGVDRFGLTFRVERPGGTREVRLPFRAPVTAPCGLPAAVRRLADRRVVGDPRSSWSPGSS